MGTRWVRRLLWCLLALALAGPAVAQPVLVLQPSDAERPLWPVVRWLPDPGGTMSADDAARRLGEFTPAPGPGSNLGIQRGVVWLAATVRVSGGDGRWVFDLDYPPFDELQLQVLAGGRTLATHTLGSRLPFAQRPLHARTHAVALDLPQGQVVQLLLRLRSDTAMVVPMALSTYDAFQSREAGRQLAQGLMLGLAAALLVYSVAGALQLSNRLFAFYALLLLGTTAFFLDFSGIGQQYLWSQRTGMTAMISPLSVLLALAAGGPFVCGALQTSLYMPRLHRLLLALSAMAAAALAAGLAGLLSYRQAQTIATLLGPVTPVLVIPAAWLHMRRGEAVGRYMLLGWSLYVVGAASMVGVLRGLLPATPWTLNLYQMMSLLEMLAWFRVLGLRIEALRLQAQQQAALVDRLATQAQTDALTGLPNRRGLEAALDPMLRAAAPGHLLGVLMIDLDGFKAVNDRLGHEAGDRLLVEVAQRLKPGLRHQDVVARLGGDEFVVLASGLHDEADLQAVTRKLLATLDAPVLVHGQPCGVGMTIGCSVAPSDGDHGAELLRRADAALYEGKRAGRRQARRYQPAADAGSRAPIVLAMSDPSSAGNVG